MYSVSNALKMTRQQFGENFAHKSFVAEYIKDQCINKNSNFIGLWTGKPGCGKTLGAIRFCELIDPQFNEKFLVLNVQELMQNIVELQKMAEKGIDVRGRCILYDEAGISMDNREWQSKVHKSINDAIETFRHLNLVLMITVPGKSRIDSKLRQLVHAEFLPMKKTAQFSIVKFLLPKYNAIKEREYKQYLLVQTNGLKLKLKTIKVKKPSIKLLRACEKKITHFKNSVGLRSLQGVMGPAQNVSGDREKKGLSDKQRKVYLLRKSGCSLNEIAAQIGITVAGVNGHIRNIRSRGYNDV